jgi:hypothetical protein
MRTQARLLLVTFAVLCGLWTLRAADPKDAKAGVLQVADLFQKKDNDAAKKAAADFAKGADLDDVMGLLKLRAKKGLGVGPKPGPPRSDGIEAFILNLDKRAPAKAVLEKQGPDFERAAYVSAAIGEIAIYKCPVEKKQKDKDPVKWKQWSEDMRDASLELADAFKAKDASAIKKAGRKLNDSCTNCHGVFRE